MLLRCILLYMLLCLRFCNGSSRLESRFLLLCSETRWSKNPGFFSYGGFGMGFQKGGGTCVSERCGFCYISDRWFVGRPCFWLLSAECRSFGSWGSLRR